ncbi:hypothetical protein J7413_09525 [Shimia sp. R10_1]|uniref:hypothetical protein n=1 Tax=Shimia sp. R10_1 TaxID=2821095 RepID=UPI001ADA10BA|nr:hypothetical protein [Shimia sp. R10_1]MBO9473774.1 hypothetical protein [Shimia sp. R10_1]
MRPLLLSIPLALLATTVQAQNVPFISGEHEDFTRLVATLPTSDTAWTINRTGQGYRIKIEGDALDLDTENVFDKIPRTRLADIRANDRTGEVDLTLACDCRVVTIPYNERYVIFDIREDLSSAPEDVPQIPLSFGEDVESVSPQRLFRFSALEAAKPVPLTPTIEQNPEQKPDFSGLLALETFVNRNVQVTTLRQDLIKQVDRATSQNLLDSQIQMPKPSNADGSVEMANGSQFKTPATPSKNMDHIPPQASIGLDGENLNIAAYNVIDEVGRDIAALLNGKVGVGTCMPDSAVNIAEWSGDKSFVEELAKIRRTLVGEFDRTDEKAIKKLVQLYVHYTFGAEALQALQLLPNTGETRVLSAMSHIVDGEVPVGDDNVFAQQGHCSGHVALWAALSGERLTGESAINGAMDGLNTLPRHLREYLGPKLSNALVNQGETEAATLVLNGIERSNPQPGTSFDFAQANLDAEMGNTDQADSTLEDIATQNTDLATHAVVELIDSHVKQDLPPSHDTISLVGALAVEHKVGAMGPPLRRAHALARMLVGEFEPAFEIIGEIEERDGVTAAVEVRSRLTNAVINHAQDFDIVSFTLSESLADPGKISPDTALALAQKMFELGFVGETKRLLQTAQNTHKNDAKRLLKARIALAESLPRRAEAELLGMTSPEAERVRAEARSLVGDHEMAAKMLSDLGDTQSAEEQNWLGGNLDALSGSETEVYRQTSDLIANSVAGNSEEDASPQGILARNRGLLENSAESRKLLDDLLNWHRLTEPSS